MESKWLTIFESIYTTWNVLSLFLTYLFKGILKAITLPRNLVHIAVSSRANLLMDMEVAYARRPLQGTYRRVSIVCNIIDCHVLLLHAPLINSNATSHWLLSGARLISCLRGLLTMFVTAAVGKCPCLLRGMISLICLGFDVKTEWLRALLMHRLHFCLVSQCHSNLLSLRSSRSLRCHIAFVSVCVSYLPLRIYNSN